MAVTVIPNVTNWSVTPQNGQAGYFTLMNTWLGESTAVIASLQAAVTAQNTANNEINVLAEQTATNAATAQAAFESAATAIALLNAGSIDDTTIATNKAFSNEYIQNNYTVTAGTGMEKVDTALNFNPSTLTTASTELETSDYVVVIDETVPKKITLTNFANEIKGIILPSITGTATFTNSTQNINLTWVGELDGLEIGDVIQITGAVNSKNNSEFTVESITDANNIVVNYEHRGQATSKALTNETSTSSVTIKILAKWYNAPIELGKGWCIPTTARSADVNYTADFPIVVSAQSNNASNVFARLVVNGIDVDSAIVGSVTANCSVVGIVPKGLQYRVTYSPGTLLKFKELR